MPFSPLDPQQKPRGSARRDADPDQLRSLYVPPAALDRYHLAAVAALKSDPAFKTVLERLRIAGSMQIAEWTFLVQASRVASVFEEMRFDEDSVSASSLLSLEALKDMAGNFQEGNGIHQVRIILEEFAEESDVWADPVIAAGQFVLMLADDYEYWLGLLGEASYGVK